MAIKTKSEGEKLILEVDNGDLEKLNKCLDLWRFKDYQSLLRFSMSVMLLTEKQNIWIQSDNAPQLIAPAKEYLKDSGN